MASDAMNRGPVLASVVRVGVIRRLGAWPGAPASRGGAPQGAPASHDDPRSALHDTEEVCPGSVATRGWAPEKGLSERATGGRRRLTPQPKAGSLTIHRIIHLPYFHTYRNAPYILTHYLLAYHAPQ